MNCRCHDDCELDCDCACHDEFDADELGLDPELDVEAAYDRYRGLNERAADNLVRRPRYPGEVVN